MRQSRPFVFLFCCLLWLLPAMTAESVKTMGPPSNYVTDLAGVLDPSTRSDLDALLKSVHDQANGQVFVVTVHKIDDDESIDQFASDLYGKWKIGNAKTDKGALLVVSVDDRKYRIEVGYGLEGILPDGKTGDIGRDMVPDLKTGNYDGAVRTAANEIADVIAQDAGVTLQTAPKHTYHREGASQGSGGGFGLFGILFIVFILIMLFRGGRGGRGGGGGGGFLSGLILGNLLGGGRSWGSGGGSNWGGGGGGWDGGGDGGGGGWGGGDGGGSFGGGDGGSSGGGGASGGW